MSDTELQAQTDKQLAIVKPTEQNFQIFAKYRNGMSCKAIGEELNLSERDVNYHVNRVRSFLGNSWRKYAETGMKLKYDKVTQSFDKLVERNDSRTVNNYLDKNVYPNKQVIETRNLNANIDLTMKAEDSDSMYDDDVKIVEAEVVDDK